jgi:hypothetical protein
MPRDERAALVVTDAHGAVAGVVRPESAEAVPVERRPWVPVSSVTLTADGATRLSPDLAGQPLITALTLHPSAVHVVEDEQGTVYGVVVTSDVESALAGRRKMS